MNPGSCDISSLQTVQEIPPCNENEFKLANVPAEKIKEMQEYTNMLRKKFPHMKAKRLGRKVAEHFKVKLV
jgi:hypothetical protein